eukprot:2470843-Pleurochrysis_carterae.AAC.1
MNHRGIWRPLSSSSTRCQDFFDSLKFILEDHEVHCSPVSFTAEGTETVELEFTAVEGERRGHRVETAAIIRSQREGVYS